MPIVVGSGPVGLSVAMGLAAAGLKVRLLEAGGDFSAADDADLLTPLFTGVPLAGAAVGRTRQLGGGLNLWGGQLAWPTQTEWLNGFGQFWARSALQSHALAALSLLGAPRVDLDQEHLTVKMPSEIPFVRSDGFEVAATGWLPKPKLSREFWSRLRKGSSIEVIQGLFIDGIDLDGESVVVGVSGVRTDGTRESIRGAPVILAAGTIESLRLLCQPNCRGEEQPWSRLPWLGRGFSEHLDANVATITPKRNDVLAAVFDPLYQARVKYTAKLLRNIDLRDGTGLSSAVMLVAPGNIRNGLSELKLLAEAVTPKALSRSVGPIFSATLAAVKEIGPLGWRYIRHRRLGTVLKGQAYLRVLAEQPARWTNRVSLSSERDRLGVRRAIVHWRTGEEEAIVFGQTARALKDSLERYGIAEVNIDRSLERDPGAFAASADDGLHHAGGARIGTSDSDGVVDMDLQVRGARGLYCCGAAVLPRMGYSNPTLLGMALGHRLSSHLVGRRPWT